MTQCKLYTLILKSIKCCLKKFTNQPTIQKQNTHKMEGWEWGEKEMSKSEWPTWRKTFNGFLNVDISVEDNAAVVFLLSSGSVLGRCHVLTSAV